MVRSLDSAGKYGDMHGLIPRVSPKGSKYFMWRGTVPGKRRDLGLGNYPYMSLAGARHKAFHYCTAAKQGRDPNYLQIRDFGEDLCAF